MSYVWFNIFMFYNSNLPTYLPTYLPTNLPTYFTPIPAITDLKRRKILINLFFACSTYPHVGTHNRYISILGNALVQPSLDKCPLRSSKFLSFQKNAKRLRRQFFNKFLSREKKLDDKSSFFQLGLTQ